MIKKTIVVYFLFVSVCLFSQGYPEPLALDTNLLGKNIKRSVSLLVNSKPEKKTNVKVLVYGQSISKQNWSDSLRVFLEKKYSHANILFKNKSIGGFSSQRLYKTVEFDVITESPDLIIFHVFGSHINYETIIKRMRECTPSDIMIQNDLIQEGSQSWSDTMSYIVLPNYSKKYQLEMVNIRKYWKQYLEMNRFKVGELLTDGLHMNAHGNFLMYHLTKRHFTYHKKELPDPTQVCRRYIVGKDIHFTDGRLVFAFQGRRVDFVTESDPDTSLHLNMLLDGMLPSYFQESYFRTRPNDIKGKDWAWETGVFIRHNNYAPLLEEEWKLKIYNIDSIEKRFEFEVLGSTSGFDGKGNNKEKFISNRGRVIIDVDDWHIWQAVTSGMLKINEGYSIEWKAYCANKDKFVPAISERKDIENVTTVLDGLNNTMHSLEIFERKWRYNALKEIRVYQPPMGRKTLKSSQFASDTLIINKGLKSIIIPIQSNTIWRLESDAWIQPVATKGSGNIELLVKLQTTNEKKARQGQMQIIDQQGKKSLTIIEKED